MAFLNPIEKAESLYNDYYIFLQENGDGLEEEILVSILAKQLAIMNVGEIIGSRVDDESFDDTLYSTSEYYNPHPNHLNYWLIVKKHLSEK